MKVDVVGKNVAAHQSRAQVVDEDSCVISGAHSFILKISSFFGLAPLRFETRCNGCVVTLSCPMCVYSYILITVLVTCTIFGIVSDFNVGTELSVRNKTGMSKVVTACDVLVVVVTAVAGVCGAPNRMRNMLKFMDSVAMLMLRLKLSRSPIRLLQVDNNLGAEYSVVYERRLRVFLLTVLVSFTILVADDFAFYVMQATKIGMGWHILATFLAYYLMYYMVILLELQFAFTSLSVHSRFRAVNDALADTGRHISLIVNTVKEKTPLNIFAVSNDPNESVARQGPLVDPLSSDHDSSVITRKSVNGKLDLSMPPCEAVRRLAFLHGALCDVVRQVDRSYGLPLLVILLSTLLHLIVTPYFLILEIMVSSNRVHFLILKFLWCVIHMLRMFVIVEPCHYTINEGKRTEDIVCRLMTFAPSTGTLPSRLEAFSRQLLLRSVSYTPMGMCTLDRPLIASVIGAVTTYLVILIQFQRYDEK